MPGSDLIQSVTRALDILADLAGRPQGAALSELAERLELKPPTAHRILRTLASRGFVEKSANPVRYRLGPAPLELAAAQWDAGMVAAAEQSLKDLAGRFPHAVLTLSRTVAGQVLCVLRLSPERPGFVERPTGHAMHPYGTASALLFQALWTEEQRAAYRERHPFWQYGAHLWSDERAVDDFLDEVRRIGYAAPGMESKGVWPLATPIFGPGGVLESALGVAVPRGRDSEQERRELVDAALRAAAELSADDRRTVQVEETTEVND
jgi:IclR family acetate operon transcriptional repressor